MEKDKKPDLLLTVKAIDFIQKMDHEASPLLSISCHVGWFSARNDHIWARGWSANRSKLVYQAASIYGLYECNAQTQIAAN